MTNPIFHVFGFRWKPEATEELKQRATRDIRAFQELFPDCYKPTWAQIFLRAARDTPIAG